MLIYFLKAFGDEEERPLREKELHFTLQGTKGVVQSPKFWLDLCHAICEDLWLV